MLPDPGPAFEREYGCLEREWLAWMPAAMHGRPYAPTGPAALRVQFEHGHLDLSWHELPPRRIALLRMPRLAVRFLFEGVTEAERVAFLKRFDLSTQRGGG